MNRYAQARAQMPRHLRRQAQAAFRKVWDRPPHTPGHPVDPVGLMITGVPGPALQCLCSTERFPDGRGLEQHVSVSRGPGWPPVDWDALVLVRSLAWDDDAEVVQLLPALEGPRAEEWVNVPGVEVLHLRRYLPAWHLDDWRPTTSTRCLTPSCP